jgi:hypothetical protein
MLLHDCVCQLLLPLLPPLRRPPLLLFPLPPLLLLPPPAIAMWLFGLLGSSAGDALPDEGRERAFARLPVGVGPEA